MIQENYLNPPTTNHRNLTLTLQRTFKEVYTAIIARISESDAVETMNIKREGFTSIPELTKKKSILD